MAKSLRHDIALMSLEEVAKRLGVTKDTVEKVERTAFKKVKQLLLERYGLTDDDVTFNGRESLWEGL